MSRVGMVCGLLGIVGVLGACGSAVFLPDPAQVALDDYIASRSAPGDQWRIQTAERVSQGRLSGEDTHPIDEAWCVTVERRRPDSGEKPGDPHRYLVYRQGGTWSAAHWAELADGSPLLALGQFCR